jgi:hypothetical protein
VSALRGAPRATRAEWVRPGLEVDGVQADNEIEIGRCGAVRRHSWGPLRQPLADQYIDCGTTACAAKQSGGRWRTLRALSFGRSPTMPPVSIGLLVKCNDLRKMRWVGDEAVASAPLPDGAVRFRIDSFALTSNNITYAAFGAAMNYWRFFPADDPAWGRIPVWGFATVAESRCVGLSSAERFYGYWPLASHAVLQPERVTANGFIDGVAHRRELHAVYNQYLRCSADPGYDAAH